MTWNKMDTLPKDRPVRLAKWADASEWNRWNKEAHWTDMGAFTAETHDHDREVVAVSADRQYWLRGGVCANGKNTLDWWRWTDLAPLPTEPAF